MPGTNAKREQSVREILCRDAESEIGQRSKGCDMIACVRYDASCQLPHGPHVGSLDDPLAMRQQRTVSCSAHAKRIH